MVSTQFGAILKELEPFFNCPLEPDQNNSCLVKMGIGLSLQIELDRTGFLLIGCRLGVLPMSRYRDNLVQQALKSNNFSTPSQGVFGFSQKSSQLIYCIRVDPSTFSTSQIITLLPPFIAKAKKWTDAIIAGQTPTVEAEAPATKGTSGIFGLMS